VGAGSLEQIGRETSKKGGLDVPSLKIAHIREQGQDIIIVPLDASFGYKSQDDQQDTIDELQFRTHSAGLAGQVVPVWNSGGGRMAFIAPRPWHPFFQSLNLNAVLASVTRELNW
jgi:hypothetical protein